MEKKLELKEMNHNGRCSDSNFYVDGLRDFGQQIFLDWKSFKERYQEDGSFLYTMNRYTCFRYDIKEERDLETDEPTGFHDLHLYMMEQEKGKFVPVLVKHIKEEEMDEITEYLELCWRYLLGQWSEVSGGKNMYPLNKA